MNKIVKWVTGSALAIVAVITVTSLMTEAYQAREIRAGGYRTLAETWPHTSPTLRAHFRESMASGAISQREYSALCEEILNELGTLEIKAGQSVEQERENLKQVMSSG